MKMILAAAFVAAATIAIVNSRHLIGITDPPSIELKGYVSDGFLRRRQRWPDTYNDGIN